MDQEPASRAGTDRPRRPGGRRWLLALVVLALLGGAVLTGVVVLGSDSAGDARWSPGAGSATPAGATPTAATPSPPSAISLSATGDIIMGNVPNRLPPNGGEGFFDPVKDALAADFVMGNLEQPLTEDTGTGKCSAGSTNCHQFRAPPHYAAHLARAGFDLLNQANNHGYDYGAAGYENTQRALEKHGLAHTGAPDQITVTDVKGVRVAVAGFSPYHWSNSLTDIPAAAAVIRKAATMADLVVVQVHMGAEGSDKTRVRPGTERIYGENRGDPIRFSRAMIDAGADLVVGHGPHVLRGMEFYRGRLIAYSLGNFAGGGNTLSKNGPLGWGGVLRVSLQPDGQWAEGRFVPTRMNGAGLPVPDPDRRGLELVNELSGSDFPNSGAAFDDEGNISPPGSG